MTKSGTDVRGPGSEPNGTVVPALGTIEVLGTAGVAEGLGAVGAGFGAGAGLGAGGVGACWWSRVRCCLRPSLASGAWSCGSESTFGTWDSSPVRAPRVWKSCSGTDTV